MATVLCSTGALLGRPNDRDYRLLKDFSKELCFDGFELMIYSCWYPEEREMLHYIQALNLNIPVIHCEKEIGECISIGGETARDAVVRFENNCRIARELNAQKLVIHLWGGLTSDSNFHNNMAAYPILAEIADKYGLDLMVENVVCNQKDPFTNWTALYKEYKDIHFIFDTKMSEFHGQTDLLYSRKYKWLFDGDHIHHFHINDYAGAYMEWSRLRTLAIGKGHVDFDKFFKYINKKGYKGTFTVESTAFDINGQVDFDMLNSQYSYIKEKTL